MKFEDLGEFERSLLMNAYRDEQVQRLRAFVGVPVCVVISALSAWFFILRDDTGGGLLLGVPILVVMIGIAVWMVLQTIANRRVRWALRGLSLQNAQAEEEVLASMKRSPRLASKRAEARSTIGGELKEGAVACKTGIGGGPTSSWGQC
jgi:hypothetical protein